MKTPEEIIPKRRFPRINFGQLLIAIFYLICIIITLILFFSAAGCKKEKFDFSEYDKLDGAEWGMPLANTKLSILDLFKDTSNIVVGENNLVKLVYKSEITSPKISSLVEIPNLQSSATYNYNMPVYVPVNDSVIVPYNQLVDFSLQDGVRVNNLVFESCIIEYGFKTNLNKDARIKVSIPNAIANNVSFSQEIEYSYSINQNTEMLITIDLSGYNVSFSEYIGKFNNLEINLEIIVFNNELPDNSPYLFEVTETANNISFSQFFGYTGNVEMSFETGAMSFDILKNRLAGNIEFEDPIVRLSAENSIGIPLSLSFSSFEAGYIDVSQPNLPVSGNGLLNPWVLNSPTQNNSTSEFSFIELNKDNSNIVEIFSSAPDNFLIVGSVITNPENRICSNYFTKDSYVKLLTEIELPLYGVANNLIIGDTFDFNFHDYNKLKNAEFKVNLTNGLAVAVDFQLYFMDQDYNISDSLFVDEETVLGADFNPQTFQVTDPFTTVLTSVIDEESLQNIKATTSYIYVKAVLNTPDDTPIKIYTDNYLEINIGAKYSNY